MGSRLTDTWSDDAVRLWKGTAGTKADTETIKAALAVRKDRFIMMMVMLLLIGKKEEASGWIKV